MDEAETILKMIETVQPDDTATLDEIDAHVYCWLNEEEYVSHVRLAGPFIVNGHRISPAKGYTRSRDALKKIRPEGCNLDHFSHVLSARGLRELLSYSCDCFPQSMEWDHIEGAHLPTEELAELHTIIQAIAHERKTK